MPKFHLIASLTLSIALVGGAAFLRFMNNQAPSAELIAVSESLNNTLENEKYAEAFLNPNSSTTIAKVNQTDLVGRQLFSEYLSLSSSNLGSSKNLVTLAQKYAQNIAAGEIGLNRVTISQILTVPDSKGNTINYANSVSALRAKYGAIIASYSKNDDIANIDNPEFAKFMSQASSLYQASANDLLLVKAPKSLAQNHLNLINNYLEISEATKIISRIDEDPIAAYKALNSYARNADQETSLLLNIQMALATSGAYSGGI